MSAISIAADFVRRHEGCELTAYADSGGVPTIGYGHTGPEVHLGLKWTQARADEQLETDLQTAETGLDKLLTRLLSDRQRAALISLAFNVGAGALHGSHVIAFVNECRWLDAACEFPRWCRAGGVQVKGLLIRRFEEAALFLKGS